MDSDTLLENNNCVTPTCPDSTFCNESQINCGCTPCEKPIISLQNTTISTFPVLSKKIYSCYSYKNNVNTLGLNAPFQIVQNPDCNYVDGAPICIDNISYSYNTIGATGSFQFFLNGSIYTFYPENDLSAICTYDILGVVGQAQANAAIESANETIALANSINTASPITDQLAILIQTAQNSDDTDVLATEAIVKIAKYLYTDSTRTKLQDALIKTAEAQYEHALAEKIVADSLTNPPPTPAEISATASAEQIPLDASNTLIEEVASIILNYQPTPSSTILNYANNAISYAQQSSAAIQATVTTPVTATTPYFTQLTSPLIESAYGLNSLIDALGLLGQTTEGIGFDTLLESMVLQTVAMFNSHLGIEATYFALQQQNTNPDVAEEDINKAIGYFIQSSQLIIESFNFTGTLQNISIYNVFESQPIKQNCCTESNNLLFVQLSPDLSVCNLQITLTGNIGDCPFTAVYNNPNTFPLSIAGYIPQGFGFYICAPCNEPFTIRQNINSSFSINCVIPNGNYSSLSPDSILVSTFSTVCQNVEVSVLTKTPLAVIANDSLVCENQNSE